MPGLWFVNSKTFVFCNDFVIFIMFLLWQPLKEAAGGRKSKPEQDLLQFVIVVLLCSSSSSASGLALMDGLCFTIKTLVWSELPFHGGMTLCVPCLLLTSRRISHWFLDSRSLAVVRLDWDSPQLQKSSLITGINYFFALNAGRFGNMFPLISKNITNSCFLVT